MAYKLCFHKTVKKISSGKQSMTLLEKVCFLQPTEQRLEVRIRIYCHSKQRQGYGKSLKGVLQQDQKETMCFVVINILQKDLCIFHHETELL